METVLEAILKGGGPMGASKRDGEEATVLEACKFSLSLKGAEVFETEGTEGSTLSVLTAKVTHCLAGSSLTFVTEAGGRKFV